MKAAGFSAKDFADAIANGGRVGDTWWQTLREGVAAGKITEDQYTALSAAIEKYGIEATKAKTLNDFFNESTQQSSTHVKDLNDAYDAAARGSTAFADAQQEGADGAERINNLLRDQADALNAQADAAQSAADQQLDVQKALVDYGDTLKDHKKTSDDVRDSAINLAKAQSELSKKQAEAAGTTLSATNNLDNLNSNLLNTAATAKGPARSAILDYIGAVNQIPTETMTDIKAAIDRGDIDEANRLLAGVSQTRTSTVKADADTAAANTELANTANPGGRPRTAQIVATVSTTAASTALSQIRGAGPRSVTPAPPAGVGATPYGAVPAATGAGAVVIPVRFALPSAADLARQIGTIRLNTKASLAAENRITGTRS
jgi:hypothetical protein